jgi:Sulfotransferase family
MARAVREGRVRKRTEEPTDSRDTSSPRDGVELRLERIEETLTEQAERSEQALAHIAQAEEDARAAGRAWMESLRRSPEGAAAESMARSLGLRRENVLPVDQPLALICQGQRSGGTLLARLFDGHPQCHAHPNELHIGDRRPHIWPSLALDESPEAWFAKMEEERLGLMFDKGKRMIPLKTQGDRPDQSYYPFLLPPAFQRLIFLQEIERRAPITSERQILDAYMTSLFNAWLDNQNLRGAEKRWVVAFSPRRAWGDGREKLFELYPDGRLISILRDPLSWFASAQGRDPEADPEALLELWKRSAREMIGAKGRYGERVFIVRFEDLVRETEKTMRPLAKFLGIDYDPVLTTPTFNGYPVGANSSYEVRSTGVVSDPVERYKELLDDKQRKRILGETKELHEEAGKLVESRPMRRRASSQGGSKKAVKPSSSKSTTGSTTRKGSGSRPRSSSGTRSQSRAGSSGRKTTRTQKSSRSSKS